MPLERSEPQPQARSGSLKAYGALAAVCVLWGTTYLGIRMGN